MEDNPIYIYINKVNQTTITNLINDIIESSQTNNNQKIIISFTSSREYRLYKFFFNSN